MIYEFAMVTFAGVICVSGEWRSPAGSCPYVGQSICPNARPGREEKAKNQKISVAHDDVLQCGIDNAATARHQSNLNPAGRHGSYRAMTVKSLFGPATG
jgi:hypothetical protein